MEYLKSFIVCMYCISWIAKTCEGHQCVEQCIRKQLQQFCTRRDCGGSPCKNRGVCQPAFNVKTGAVQYSCQCQPGYTGPTCETECLAVYANATPVYSYGSEGSEVGEFSVITGLSISKNGHVALADNIQDRVYVLDHTLKYINSFEVIEPTDVAFISDGRLLVARAGGVNMVSEYMEDGTLLQYFSTQEDNIYLAAEDGSYYLFNSSNDFVREFKNGEPPLNMSVGTLAFDGLGNIIASDLYEPVVKFFDKDFNSKGKIGPFDFPELVRLTPDGNFIVQDAIKRCIKLFQVPYDCPKGSTG